ncbi:DEAD/DEAH box helicase [Streptomyces sp. NPDC048845]|uniref:DEAD/DEAH box helicase n=1 Tax=Streptomyces sp. NPDC048845 TaxID=3155390 RepID=UPI003422782B
MNGDEAAAVTAGRAETEGAKAAVAPGRATRDLLRRAGELRSAAAALVADRDSAVRDVREALRPLVDELVGRGLDGIPVARLKDVTEGRLRLGALEQAGYRSVRHVRDATAYDLRRVPGVGAHTAAQALAAAGQIARAVEESVAVRIDIGRRDDPATTALVVALARLVAAGPDIGPAAALARRLDGELSGLLPRARPAAGRLRLLVTRPSRRAGAREAAARIGAVLDEAAAGSVRLRLAQASADLLRAPGSRDEAWLDFEVRSADYYGLLAEIAGQAPDREAAEGFLPSGIAERVRDQPLDDTHRRVSLRGYQSFGARFALVQRRVILGDEMGLGKTVQAIAAMAHLAAGDGTHFLVVCPASVLVNWVRETESRSALRVFPVHGTDRADHAAEWAGRGGVAVTTFDGLRTLDAHVPAAPAPAMLVVDEAHFVKNPEARRTRAVAAWTERAERVLFLTGTPMENRVEEFRSLVRLLRPDLLPQVGPGDAAAGSRAFRRAVAPAYLRRNQDDVLTELPELVRVDEWEDFSASDAEAYREAVESGNFMAMRRAGFARPEGSAKLERLLELVEEARQNGLKAVVFSYFRDVLATVRTALSEAGSPAVLGPVSGDVAAASRQRLVDDFTAAAGHAVLLGQIQAGGVGLNLQAASVVILCEPQLKPTTENQAVARAHRMGQVRGVQVHRLLNTGGVDERLLTLLDRKNRLFDAYARRSDLAESASEAVDVSEQSLARRIVEEEQARLAAG